MSKYAKEHDQYNTKGCYHLNGVSDIKERSALNFHNNVTGILLYVLFLILNKM